MPLIDLMIFGTLNHRVPGSSPVFPNRGNRPRSKRGRFCGELFTYFLTFPVSAENTGLSGGFLVFSLRPQKFRSWRPVMHSKKRAFASRHPWAVMSSDRAAFFRQLQHMRLHKRHGAAEQAAHRPAVRETEAHPYLGKGIHGSSLQDGDPLAVTANKTVLE
jgi:hypothetical protein